MATTDVINYYANLLIFQYLQQRRAYAHIQTLVTPFLMPDSNVQEVTFYKSPVSGHFKINYGGVLSAFINWNDSAGTIQAALSAILPSPVTVVVSGSIAAGLVFTFNNFTSSISMLAIESNTMVDISSGEALPSVIPIGDQLSLEVQEGFNLSGSNTAVGVQLDTIAKYVGVVRSAFGFFGPITLDDADFLTFIQIGIIRNRSGSSLATIQALLNEFFAGEIYVFDYTNMNMSYLIDTSIGSEQLLEMFITQDLLPRPMGVGLSVIAHPVINKFFGFRTYFAAASPLTTPFNSYASYDLSWLFMSYAYAVTP